MPDVIPTRMTQLDIMKQTGQTGNVLRTAEILHEKNPLFQDMKLIEASDFNMHRVARTASLGSDPDIRNLNEGVTETKADVTNDEERLIQVEKYATIDAKIFNGKNGKAVRDNQNELIIEKIGQYVNRKLIYGGPADGVSHVVGFANRRTTPTDQKSQFHNVIDNGNADSGKNTSIYIVNHGVGKLYGVYPMGTKGGITVQNIPEYTETYDDGGVTKKMQVVSTLFGVGFGIVEEDPMSLIRIANISPYSDGGAGEQMLDPKKLIEALNYIRSTAGTVIYANRAVMTWLTSDAVYKDNVNYDMKDPYGKPLMSFMGVPIRLMEAINNGEQIIS